MRPPTLRRTTTPCSRPSSRTGTSPIWAMRAIPRTSARSRRAASSLELARGPERLVRGAPGHPHAEEPTTSPSRRTPYAKLSSDPGRVSSPHRLQFREHVNGRARAELWKLRGDSPREDCLLRLCVRANTSPYEAGTRLIFVLSVLAVEAKLVLFARLPRRPTVGLSGPVPGRTAASLLRFASRSDRYPVTDQRTDNECDREPAQERDSNERCPVHAEIIGRSHAGCLTFPGHL